jgi:glycosyltransferase involved in cell wall biosynthesis
MFMPTIGGGGAERIMLNLARCLLDHGLSVDLILAQAAGAFMDEIPDAIRVVDLGAHRLTASLPPLARHLRRDRPPVLLTALNNANIVALLAHRLAMVPTRIVVTEHNTMSQLVASHPHRRAKLKPLLTRLTYAWADGIIAVSKGVAEDLSRVAGVPMDRIQVIYNPVITPEMMAKAAERVDHPWFAPGSPPLILGVGRLMPQKDFPNLIRAFASLRARREARLLILGEGADRPDLEALIDRLGVGSDVQLPGFVANPYAYMACADLFVLSSAWEGLPTVLIEAMGAGAPVVATDCRSGPREILDGGRLAPLVPVNDSEALAAAMLAALDDPPDRAQLLERSRDYSLEQIPQQYIEAMRRVL